VVDKEKFEEDLNSLVQKLVQGVDKKTEEKLEALKRELIRMHTENLVKINHSVMELVCAKNLILKGYEVLIENRLSETLTCDLYAVKGYGSLIVEVETGFIPPEHALDPTTYLLARIASKIIRYSSQAGKFALATPPHYVLSFPRVFVTPSKDRTSEEVKSIKRLCDLYYQNPPITIEEVRNARLHSIFIVDVDRTVVEEFDPETYIEKCNIAP
jgi:hypothetical protein